jgi:O-antigen/teichoic acid export membrane protein
MRPTLERTRRSTEQLTTPSSVSVGRRILVNTGSLTGSSLWRIFISFVLQILISRLLGVAEFGQYVSVLAFLNVSQVVSELGLPTLLVRNLAQHPDLRRAYFFLALRVQMAAAFFTWLGLVLLIWLLPVSSASQTALWLAGASLPFYAVTSVSQTLFKASERMELVMGVEGVVNALILLFSIVAMWLGGGIISLVAVLVLTQALSAGMYTLLLARNHLLTGDRADADVGWYMLWRAARPFYWLSLADVLLHRLDILLLNVFAGDLLTGIYSIAYSVVRIIVKLIQSYWQALYPTISRLFRHRKDQYQRLSSLSLRYGLILVLPAAAIGFGVADNVLHLLYGADAAPSVPVFQILIWSTPFFLIEMYAVTQLMATGYPQLSLRVTWVHIFAVLLLLPILTSQIDAVGAAIALVVASASGAIAGEVLMRGRSLVWEVPHITILIGATCIAGLLATLLPIPWIARTLCAGGVYLGIIWLTGVFAPNDRQIFRDALRLR